MATEAELIAAGYLNNPGYQNFRNWIAAGAKHGSLGGKVLNPAVVRHVDTAWGEGLDYDAAGNLVSLYMDAPAGVVSPYGPAGTGGPSAPGPPPPRFPGRSSADDFGNPPQGDTTLAVGPAIRDAIINVLGGATMKTPIGAAAPTNPETVQTAHIQSLRAEIARRLRLVTGAGGSSVTPYAI